MAGGSICSVGRLRSRTARAEGRTATACHTARGIPQPNRTYSHHPHTRTDAADPSPATVPLSSRVSCAASRVSHTGARVSHTSTRADAQPADLASPSVDNRKSPTGQHPELAPRQIADRDVHTARLGSRRPNPQTHRTPGNASEHQAALNATNRSERTDRRPRHQPGQPRAGQRAHHTRTRPKPTLCAAP